MKRSSHSGPGPLVNSRLWKWFFPTVIMIVIMAFNGDELAHKLAVQAKQKLSAFHGIDHVALKIKKCEITISDEGFLRYRKTYISGKQEYYSFNLSRLQSIDYLGSSGSGNLIIRTMEDDIIVQTYNDRSGNVDSMSVDMKISLQAIEAEDLAGLQQDLFELKRLVSRN
ncbi:hypothetical protein [Daejeonella sp.]|uniref:hypothetical protein n=1 Tax=Daejeonella sp. TaxID=2805397 RepID=UPI0030BC9585